MKTIKSVIRLLGAFALATAIGPVCAGSFPEKDGYLTDERGILVRNGFGGCWRTGYWEPHMAIAECDPDLVPKAQAKETRPMPSAPPPSLAVARKPEPAAAPEKPVEEARFNAETLFAFDEAELTPEGRKILDEKIVAGMKSHPEVEFLMVTGHADRIGTEEYNQRLSERRAYAVAVYLANQGVAAGRIKVMGKGESEPDPEANTRQTCGGFRGDNLIACLQPDRRVTVVPQKQADR